MRPIAVFDPGGVQVVPSKSCHGRHAEGQMDIDIVGDVFFGAGDDVQLSMFGDAKPHMLSVVEGFGDSFEFQYLLIKIRGPVQVRYKNGRMAEMRSLRMGRQC